MSTTLPQPTTMLPESTAVRPRPELSPAKQALRETRLRGLGIASPAIPRRAEEGDAPLSFAQERLWFLDRVQPGLAAYNLPTAWRLSGPVDEAALERALGEIVRRHQALRTTFREADGVPAQVVAPFVGFALAVDPIEGVDEAEREAEARRRVAEEAARPFDLEAGPLFRVRLLRLGAEERVLVVVMHHAVCDGWSMGVFLPGLLALYGALREGREPPPGEPPVQYADYAAWQRGQLRGGALERHLAYWRERLAGAPALLELPTDRSRPAVQAYRGGRERMELAGALLARLEALARGEGATPFMVLLAAFQLLLGRYAGSDDVVVGTPASGRTHCELEGLIGLFVNSLVLRTDLSGDPTFRELLHRVREVVLGAWEHQEAPFDRVVAELRPERTMGHAPLFQAELILQTAGPPAAAPAGTAVRALEMEQGTARFDLSLDALLHPGGIRFALEYRADLFDAATARRMLEHLQAVLEQAAADPDVRISALELMGPTERRRMLEEWNRAGGVDVPDRCIHQLFEAQAARTPDAAALVCEDLSISYRALNERANRLAHHLVRLGVGPEARVGVCLERRPELVVALLAVLKAGGAYVPLDPAYPPERLALIVADAAAPVLVTRDSLRALLPVHDGVRVVAVDGAAAEIAAERADDPASGAAPRNLAYLMYTSGSTGVPKGVAVEHACTVALLAWAWSVCTPEELGGMLASTSICFDLSVFELFAPLTRGGRVILVENALALPRSAAADQVRLIDTVPSAIDALLKSDGIPPGVRTVTLCGEPLSVELADALYACGIECVYDLYGPSEDTTFSTVALRRPGGPATIGGPLPGTRCYLLDAALRPVPAGVPGELYLGGRGVTRGYLGQPGATAARYLPDPFGSEAGARLYRTGDRVRWRADGTLEYLGRLDAQVKIRGFRVEPGEIEAALRRHPGVEACVVVARGDASSGRRLVAYIAGGADLEALRAHLRRTLPEHMVPAAFVALDRLLLNPNGKVDRGALPEPEPPRAETAYAAPRGPREEALAAIWAEVLGVERVGAHDNFFALGGDSLLFVRVVSRARKTGLEITPRQLFEQGTVAALAAVARTREDGGTGDEDGVAWEPAALPERREGGGRTPADFPLAEVTQDELDRMLADGRGVEDLYPLSPMQEGMLYHALFGGDSQAFQIQTAQRLEASVDVDLLQRVWAEVIRRHPFLRTSFAWEGLRRPLQRVETEGRPPWVIEDWRGLSADEQEAALERYLAGDRARGFELTRAPLLRFALFRTGDEGYWLVWSLHHLVLDGWSWSLIRREVFDLYRAWGAGEPLEPRPARPYRDYIAWLARQDPGAAERYWRRALSGFAAPTPLGADHAPDADAERRWVSLGVKLSEERARRLEEGARRRHVTLHTLLQGAWGLLLSRYGGEDDVLFGSLEPGRPAALEGVEEMVGLFINPLPLRLRVRGDARVGEWLRGLQLERAEAREHEHAPLSQVQGWSEVPRGTRLFDSMLVFEKYPAGFTGSGPGGLKLGRRRVIFWTDYPLTLVASTTPVFELIFTYDVARFKADDIERMAAYLVRLLDRFADQDDDARLAELAPLDEAERRRLEAGRRASAPHPLPPRPAASGSGRRPQTGLEARLVELWQEVLGVEEVGVEDRFFDLGGHSMLLVRLQSGLARELGRDVPMVELLHHSTIRALAGWLQAGTATGGAAEQGEARGGVRQATTGRLPPRRPRGA